MQARPIISSGARPTELKRADNSPHQIEREDTTMSECKIIATVRELREIEALIEEAKAQAEALKDAIKSEMGTSELLKAGEYTIRWQTVTTTKLDTAAIKKLFSAEDLEGFTKTTTVRRFSIA